MAKRINISVPDELYVKIDHHRNRLKISKICQVALEKAVIAADAKEDYNRIGYSDGLKRSEKMTPKDIKKLQEIMNGEDRYSHWSQVEKVHEVYERFMDDCVENKRFADIGNTDSLTHEGKIIDDEDEVALIFYEYREGWVNGIMSREEQ